MVFSLLKLCPMLLKWSYSILLHCSAQYQLDKTCYLQRNFLEHCDLTVFIRTAFCPHYTKNFLHQFFQTIIPRILHFVHIFQWFQTKQQPTEFQLFSWAECNASHPLTLSSSQLKHNFSVLASLFKIIAPTSHTC
jgi:hypothetical protein